MLAAVSASPGNDGGGEMDHDITTCDGCSFEDINRDSDDGFVCVCTRAKRALDNFPVIPSWCPLPTVMGGAESLLSTLQEYIDIRSDKLLEQVKFFEDRGERCSEGWIEVHQRLYELDNVYELIHRITETNVTKDKKEAES